MITDPRVSNRILLCPQLPTEPAGSPVAGGQGNVVSVALGKPPFLVYWLSLFPPPTAGQQKQEEGRKGRYMLHNFGKVYSARHHHKATDYQVNFVATKTKRSLIVVSMVADDLKLVIHK